MNRKSIQKIGNIIIVASGKGGVGKSSVATNLAVLLGRDFNVGLLDADIYGPSISFMLGAKSKIQMNDQEKFVPHEKFGIKFISIGSMVDENSPAIWRGPMLIKMLYNFLLKTEWGELDYLIIDTPPGTGDIHLTLCTEFSISSVILVTTAQRLAMLDVKKAFYMFKKLCVPVLGIVENMSYQIDIGNYILGNKKNTEIFASELGTKIIAKIPFIRQISESFDNSIPAVLDLNIAKFYNQLTDAITCTKK